MRGVCQTAFIRFTRAPRCSRALARCVPRGAPAAAVSGRSPLGPRRSGCAPASRAERTPVRSPFWIARDSRRSALASIPIQRLIYDELNHAGHMTIPAPAPFRCSLLSRSSARLALQSVLQLALQTPQPILIFALIRLRAPEDGHVVVLCVQAVYSMRREVTQGVRTSRAGKRGSDDLRRPNWHATDDDLPGRISAFPTKIGTHRLQRRMQH
jgi:hypothetical protein